MIFKNSSSSQQSHDMFLLKKSLEFPLPLRSPSKELKIGEVSERLAAKWLDWLSEKSFHDAVDLPQNSYSLSRIMEGALSSLYKIASLEIKRLSMPTLYLSWLEEAIQRADFKALNQIFHEIGYKRFETGLDLLLLKKEESKMPVASKVEQARSLLESQEESTQSKYLLQQLKTLPRLSSQTFSEIESAKIELMALCYLDPIAGFQDHSFYRYLQEKSFSPLFWNTETLNLFLYLHKQFVMEKIESIKRRKEPVLGQEHLVEELEHIEPTSFSHLEEIVQSIDKKEEVTFQACCNRHFFWAVQKQLDLWVLHKYPYYRPWRSAFESIPSLDTEIALLEHLYKEADPVFLRDLLHIPEIRTLEAGFAFLKKFLEKNVDTSQFLSLYEKFEHPRSGSFQIHLQEIEKSTENLQRVTSWMENEGKGSLLHKFLQQENFLDGEGRIIKKEISEVVQWTKYLLHLQRFRDLVILRRKQQGLESLQCRLEFSSQGLWSINDIAKDLVGEEIFSYTQQETDEIFTFPPYSWLNTYLQEIGVSIDKKDDQYRMWIELFVKRLERMIPTIQFAIERLPPFYVNVLRTAKQDLHNALETGEYRRIAEIADRILYTKYLGALFCEKIPHKNAVQKILAAQSKEHLPPHEMIVQAKKDLYKLPLSLDDKQYLLNILEGKDEENVEGISWINDTYQKILSSKYFRSLLRIESFSSPISICQKMEQIECILNYLVQNAERELTDSFYPYLIKKGSSQRNFEMLFWLFLEALHKKYQRHLSLLKEQGKDVSALDSVENVYETISVYKKIPRIIEILTENIGNAPYRELLQILSSHSEVSP